MMRTVLGEVRLFFQYVDSEDLFSNSARVQPTGTSPKFANMMEQALLVFAQEHKATLEKITKIPLEGEGTIEKRVERYEIMSFCSNAPRG